MKIKLGHRKYLVNEIRCLDILSAFLKEADLLDHLNHLRELGFQTEWSILGVKEEYAPQMDLSEEEMKRWLEQQKKMVYLNRDNKNK